MLHPRPSDLVDTIRASLPPDGMHTTIVAIDGRGGSGKSTLARVLSYELSAPVVHTDDFASWDNPVDWWPELVESVLEPLAHGWIASYRPSSWGGPEKAAV